jgi:hypothetical protein
MPVPVLQLTSPISVFFLPVCVIIMPEKDAVQKLPYTYCILDWENQMLLIRNNQLADPTACILPLRWSAVSSVKGGVV